jgi:hypothetical protein
MSRILTKESRTAEYDHRKGHARGPAFLLGTREQSLAFSEIGTDYFKQEKGIRNTRITASSGISGRKAPGRCGLVFLETTTSPGGPLMGLMRSR